MTVDGEAGKDDTPRPCDQERYRANLARIFKKAKQAHRAARARRKKRGKS